MVQYITENRLPKFTEEESKLLQNSFDYMGVNHYTSVYVKHTGTPGTHYGNDKRSDSSGTNNKGQEIGPVAESGWLRKYAPGFKNLLVWI
jgi:beta-glucosidase